MTDIPTFNHILPMTQRQADNLESFAEERKAALLARKAQKNRGNNRAINIMLRNYDALITFVRTWRAKHTPERCLI